MRHTNLHAYIKLSCSCIYTYVATRHLKCVQVFYFCSFWECHTSSLEWTFLLWYSSQVPTGREVYFTYICVSTISQPCSLYLRQQNIIIEYFRALFERWWKNLKGSSENRLVFLTKNLDNRTVLLFGMPVCMLFAS